MKKINIDYIPDFVLTDAMKNQGFEPDDEKGIDFMQQFTALEIFDFYCCWNGLIGHSYRLFEAVLGLKEAEEKKHEGLM